MECSHGRRSQSSSASTLSVVDKEVANLAGFDGLCK